MRKGLELLQQLCGINPTFLSKMPEELTVFVQNALIELDYIKIN